MLAFNTIAMTAALVVDKATFLLLILYFTRVQGVESYGRYLTVITFIFIFRVVSNCGVNRLFVRDLARDFSLARKYFSNATAIALGLSIACYPLILASGRIFGYPKEILVLLSIAGLSIIPFNLALVFDSILQAAQKMSRTAFWGALNSTLTVVLGIAALRSGFGLGGVFLAMVLVNLLYAAGLYGSVRGLGVSGGFRIDPSFIGRTVREAVPFSVFIILGMVQISAGIIILSLTCTNREVGLFGAPLKLTEAFLIIPQALGTALFPVISRNFNESVEALTEKYEKALRYLMIAVLPFGTITWALSGPIVRIVFGEGYAPSGPVLSVLGWSTVITFVNSPGVILIMNSSLFRRFVPWYGISLLLGTGISYFLITGYGHMGAAYGKLVTEGLITVVVWVFLKSILGKAPSVPKTMFKPAMASLACWACILVLGGMNPVLLAGAALLVYGAALWMLGELSMEEFARLKNGVLKGS